MNQELTQKLKEWRSNEANLEGVERDVILHYKTIKEIAEKLSKNEEELKVTNKGFCGNKLIPVVE